MRFFHVSRHDLGETVTMEVKLPWMCNIATEGDIPRICVSPIIHHCLRAVSSCVSNFTVNDALDHAKIETVFGESIEEYVERVPYIRGQSVYYSFNYYPERKDVTLTYTLDKCDMDKQLDESLASLRRLYESKT